MHGLQGFAVVVLTPQAASEAGTPEECDAGLAVARSRACA